MRNSSVPGGLTRFLARAGSGNIRHETVRSHAASNVVRLAVLAAIFGAGGIGVNREISQGNQAATAGTGLELANPKDNQELQCLRELAREAAIGKRSIFGDSWIDEQCDTTQVTRIRQDKHPLAAASSERDDLLEKNGVSPGSEEWLQTSPPGEPTVFLVTTHHPGSITTVEEFHQGE